MKSYYFLTNKEIQIQMNKTWYQLKIFSFKESKGGLPLCVGKSDWNFLHTTHVVLFWWLQKLRKVF